MTRYHFAWEISDLLTLSDAALVGAVQRTDTKERLSAEALRAHLRELRAKGQKAIPLPNCHEADEKGYCKGFEA